ncbi:MAG: PQQ-like beta-propeller repeat protein, partial [Abditibacteriota bacterium]|nr:PQQ-like beta-propeller repeat protein [Abditibacteriota bacterium]
MKKSVLGIIFLIAALTTLLAVAAMAQNLGQTVNAENTGYIEGDLDLPLVYSFDRAIKFSSLNSYGTAGMTGGGMGATLGGVTGGGMTGTGTGNNISTSRLSIGDKSILVATSTKVYSFEKNKGRLNWQYPSNNDMENGVTCIPVAYDNKVYFSNTKILYSLDEETGEVLKMRNIPNSTIAMASVVDGILYFCAGDGKIYRLDPDTLDDAASPLSEEKVILSNG